MCWEMDEQAFVVLVFAGQCFQASEIDVVAKVPSWISTQNRLMASFHCKLLHFFEVELSLEWRFKVHIGSDFLVARLIASIVGNAEILVVVGSRFQVIDLVGPNPKVQVQNLLSLPLGQLRLNCFDVLISISSCHLYN